VHFTVNNTLKNIFATTTVAVSVFLAKREDEKEGGILTP
jgi:hypothetical protein